MGLREAFDDCAITTDIMTGFVGETDEDFAETLEFVKEMDFYEAHVFRYSQRRGTPAAKRSGQIPAEVKEARSKAIITVTDISHMHFLERHIGRTMDVLYETKAKAGCYEGKTANYITVWAPSDIDISGKFRKTRLDYIEDGVIHGTLLD